MPPNGRLSVVNVRRAISLLAAVALVAIVVVGLGFVTGVLGVPSVESVDNRFAGVNESTTVVATTLELTNPNPFAISLGGLAVDHTITMNGVEMGSGHQEGITLRQDNATVPFRTFVDNGQIPEWWYTHVKNGERTRVTVHADVSHGLVDEAVSVQRQRTFRTDVLTGFNRSETRAIDANLGFVEDPVLYVNETTAHWGANVTRRWTPISLNATVYNPRPFPYTITAVGYTIEMNGVEVGAGRTARGVVVPGNSAETVQARAVIDNSRLDEWWVTHVERGQRTNVTVDLFVLVDPPEWLPGDTDTIRIDHPRLDYETSFETDVFGENGSGTGLVGDSVPARRQLAVSRATPLSNSRG